MRVHVRSPARGVVVPEVPCAPLTVGRQSTTPATVDVRVTIPNPETTTASRTTHSSRLTTGPPNITAIFLGTDRAQNARCASCGPSSSADAARASWTRVGRPSRRGFSTRPGRSGGNMPEIDTNPPNGSALMPYSVSPRFVDHSVGPKPMK